VELTTADALSFTTTRIDVAFVFATPKLSAPVVIVTVIFGETSAAAAFHTFVRISVSMFVTG